MFPSRFSYASSILSFPNLRNNFVDIVLYPNKPSNSISPTKTRLVLEISTLPNSDTDIDGSENMFLTDARLGLSTRILGFGNDFWLQISKSIDKIFCTDFEYSVITSSVGFDRSRELNFDTISGSERFGPPDMICLSRFSALTSSTTSVGP